MSRATITIALASLLLTSACATTFELQPGQTSQEFEMQSAKCRMMARSTATGYFAMGSPAFVAGAGLGNAIGNAIVVAANYKDCMIASGYFPKNDKG